MNIPPNRNLDQFFFSDEAQILLETLCSKYSSVTGVFCPSLLHIPNIQVFDIDPRFSAPNYSQKDLQQETGENFLGDLIIIDPPYTLSLNFPIQSWINRAQQLNKHILIACGKSMESQTKTWNLRKQSILPSYKNCSNILFEKAESPILIQAWWYANFPLLKTLLSTK